MCALQSCLCECAYVYACVRIFVCMCVNDVCVRDTCVCMCVGVLIRFPSVIMLKWTMITNDIVVT